MNDENAFKASRGLYGGIGGKQDVCGSLLGAAMMLGLAFGGGEDEASTPDDKENPARMVGQLYERFKKDFGSVKCRTIITRFAKEVDADINNKGLDEPTRMAKVFSKCDEMCGRNAANTAEMIWDALNKGK